MWSSKSATYQAWLTAVVDVYQIAVQVEVLISAHLDSGVSWLIGLSCWWEVDLGVESVWCNLNSGDGLRSKFGIVDDDLLDLRPRWLWPEGNEWCHCCFGGAAKWDCV